MESLARWSANHRKRVVVIWLLLLVASLGTASRLKNHFNNDLALPNTGAQRATDLLRSRFPAFAGDSDQIVSQTSDGKLSDPVNRRRIERTLAAVASLPHVSVADPFGNPQAISHGGTIGFATVNLDKRGDALPKSAVSRVIASARAASTTGFDVELGGYAIEQTELPTLGAATAIGIVAAMVVLYLSFGSLFAMVLPILCALFGLGTSMGLIAGLTHVLATPDFATQLALLIGLGVGVDYALFVVTRYRDAFSQNGGDVFEAVALAMNTAGRSIAFEGATVIVAVLGLLAVGVHIFYGVALAISLTVLLVLAASLTLLPALLSLSGRRIGRREPTRERGAPGLWGRWIGVIQRRPAIAAVASTAFLLLLAAPVLGLRLAASDASNDRGSTTTHKAYELLSRGFGAGFNGPLQIAVRVPPGGAESDVERVRRSIAATSGVASVAPAVFNRAPDTAAFSVFPKTAPESRQTYDLVKRLRSVVIPPVALPASLAVFVGGSTASQVDLAHVLSTKLPYFIGAVIVLSALLLIPVIVFAIVFGLSMDYEVFLVSRIHEEWTHGADHSAAVRNGLTRTSRVVAAAAAVMVVVFSSFVASSNHILKLLGLSLAVAVFLDAVVIRSILLPAVLELFGRRWAFPAWADRLLPRLAIEPAEKPHQRIHDRPSPSEAS